MDLQEFGERLRMVRKHLGLTQTQLARESQLSQTSISRLENGQEVYGSAIISILKFYSDKIHLDYLYADVFDINSYQLLRKDAHKTRNDIQQYLDAMTNSITASAAANLHQLELLKKSIASV